MVALWVGRAYYIHMSTQQLKEVRIRMQVLGATADALAAHMQLSMLKRK
jgi:hypothetical protein